MMTSVPEEGNLTQQLLSMPLRMHQVATANLDKQLILNAVREHYEHALGKYGQLSQQLSKRKLDIRRQCFSMTMISAMT
jgi:hypothetical protein